MLALLKIRVSDEHQNDLEFFDDNGEFVVIKGPRLRNKSSKEKKKSLERWLHKYLLPLLSKWTKKLIKKLPEGMTALSTFVGVDMENHAGSILARNRCQQKSLGEKPQASHPHHRILVRAPFPSHKGRKYQEPPEPH